jgi:hypothetical protein
MPMVALLLHSTINPTLSTVLKVLYVQSCTRGVPWRHPMVVTEGAVQLEQTCLQKRSKPSATRLACC